MAARKSAHTTATDADSVAVNAPERMPAMMITTTSRPGNDSANERHTMAQPGKVPAG